MHYTSTMLRQFALAVVILAGIATILASYHKENEFPGDRTAASADFLRHVRTGSRVDLDARASNILVSDEYIYYRWILRGFPTGSKTELSNSFGSTTSFIADLDGEYTVELQTGTSIFSPDDSITYAIAAHTGNAPPLAETDANQEVMVGQTVQLDGSLSYDADDDVLGYSWDFIVSAGESLSESSIVNPTFVPSKVQTYQLGLVVNDGAEESSTNFIFIYANAAGSSYPVAMAGPDQYVLTGSTVQLDGSASYSPEPGVNDFNLLGYEWRILSRPNNSEAVLSNRTLSPRHSRLM